MAVLIALFEPAANTLLAFLADAPALLQVIAFFTVWAVCWLPVALGLGIALNWQPFQPLTPKQKLPLLVSLYLIAPLILWAASWLTEVTFSNYGFAVNLSILRSLGLGFAIAVLSLALVFTIQFWLDWCTWQQSNNNIETRNFLSLLVSILMPILLLALLVGGIEELIFRGFVFTQLVQDYPLITAAAISSFIFALLHLVWEQKETIPQLPGLWLMGMVLVLGRLVDGGSLGIAWGLHAGWVWAIATIDTAQLIHYTGKAPEWVTGKDKKPLAGAAGILCLLTTGIVLWLFSGYL